MAFSLVSQRIFEKKPVYYWNRILCSVKWCLFQFRVLKYPISYDRLIKFV